MDGCHLPPDEPSEETIQEPVDEIEQEPEEEPVSTEGTSGGGSSGGGSPVKKPLCGNTCIGGLVPNVANGCNCQVPTRPGSNFDSSFGACHFTPCPWALSGFVKVDETLCVTINVDSCDENCAERICVEGILSRPMEILGRIHTCALRAVHRNEYLETSHYMLHLD
jgi:hypothetical protein